MMLSSQTVNVGPLYVDALRDAGKIQTSEFSFALYGMNEDYSATIDFGQPLAERVLNGLSAMVEVPMNEDFFWSQTWQGSDFDMDDPNHSRSYSVGNPYTILDTGSSHMFLPYDFFESFIV